ncbi:MAG: glycosyltransferase [Pseudomonadota bacterium]
MNLRVLHIIPSVAACRGGPSKAIIEMVAALTQAGVKAEIAATNDNGDQLLDVPLEQPYMYQGVPIRFFHRWSPGVAALREFQYSAGFRHWLRDHIDNYDLIHVHAVFSFTSSYAMYLARKRGVPYVVRPIGQLEHWALQQGGLKKRLYMTLVERRNLEGAAAIHFTAASELQQARESINTENAQVIPLGITPPALLENAQQIIRTQFDLAADQPLLVYLSRLHPKKGLELLLQAVAQLEPPCSLLIAGNGDAEYVASLKREVRSLGLEQQVQFIGFVQGEQRDQLLQGADLFALTSYSENFGIAVLEALAAGTPCLVTEGVALASEIREQRLGYVAASDVDAIKSALQRALNEIDEHPAWRKEIRQTIRDRYHWPAIAGQLATLYEELRR